MDGIQADEVSQEQSNHLRAPDIQFESSPNYIEALFAT